MDTTPEVGPDTFEDLADADHRIENLLGGKIQVDHEGTSDIDKIKNRDRVIKGDGNKDQSPSNKRSGPLPTHKELKDKYSQFFSKQTQIGNEKEKENVIDHFAHSEYDINKIESGPVLLEEIVYGNIGKAINEYRSMTAHIKSAKEINVSKLKEFVQALINETGPNQNSSLLLVNLVGSSNEDYFASHSINVLIFTLIIAIESSKMMMEKVQTPEISKDFFKTRLCSLKTFKEKELIDLGVAALLHDISVKVKFPDIAVNSNLSFRDQLEFKRHSIESFRMVEELKIDRDIELAILQHHEQLDGGGYPDGISERVINRYAKVLALADHYENLSFVNPFTPAIGPVAAINQLLRKEKSAYDGDLLISFLKATSLFPLGSFILLSSGEIGMVVETDKKTMQKPKVKILFSKDKVQVKKPVLLDLNEYPDIRVSRAVHPREVKTALPQIRKQLGLM